MGNRSDKSSKPNIYNYHDYRSFLKDWLDHQKAVDKKFSARKFSQECGIAGGYLSMVINGKRNLTKKALYKLQNALKLTPAEINYFECLQTISDDKSQIKRLEALKKMHRYGNYKKSHVDDATLYAYLSNWINIAIREMADLGMSKLDAEWIQQNLIEKVHKHDIEKALNFLITNNYITINENGEPELNEKHLKAEGVTHKMGLTEFHKQMFQLATNSIDLVPSHSRWINGMTLAISADQYDEIVKIMNDAKDRVAKVKNDKKSNEIVYHTAFVAFPLTQLKGSG